jgi:hypothetical protein
VGRVIEETFRPVGQIQLELGFPDPDESLPDTYSFVEEPVADIEQ